MKCHDRFVLGRVSAQQNKTRGVSHCGLAILHLKSIILRQKKNDGNSNISPCKNYINLQKKSSKKKETKILQDIIITL
jgi:hypothetical protein